MAIRNITTITLGMLDNLKKVAQTTAVTSKTTKQAREMSNFQSEVMPAPFWGRVGNAFGYLNSE